MYKDSGVLNIHILCKYGKKGNNFCAYLSVLAFESQELFLNIVAGMDMCSSKYALKISKIPSIILLYTPIPLFSDITS